MPSQHQNSVEAAKAADHGEYNSNNISQYRICVGEGEYIHVGSETYVLCIPHVEYETTKMDVARAVEQCILQIDGVSENFRYVKKVIFVRAFDEIAFNTTNIMNSNSEELGSSPGPWYKIAMVQIDIPHGYDEYGVEIYTDYEEKFYGSVCRGDLVIGTWADAFFVANPKKYFRPQYNQEDLTQHQQQQQQAKKEVCEYQDGAFQKWKYEFKLKQLERKVKEQENTIRKFEMDAGRYQDTVNECKENFRFLARQKVGSRDLDGLNCMSNGLSNYLSALSNRYSRVCISDISFLEINKNMKLKKMHGLVINMCDDGDACQELVHSIDFVRPDERGEVFSQIEKMICRINHSVQNFEKLHLHAERSLFGLRNRKVFDEFSMFLNTALEIVEEVTSRVSTFTQDLEYTRCYGQLSTRYGQQEEQQQCEERSEFATSAGTVYGYGYNYDYSECADPLNQDAEVESTHQMLSYFDQRQQQLYHQQKCEQEQQEQEQQEQQTGLNLDTIDVVYYEEGVIIEGVIIDESQEKSTTTTSTITSKTTTKTTELEDAENKKKKGSWLSSWF